MAFDDMPSRAATTRFEAIENAALVLELRASGKTPRQVAEETGLTKNNVHRLLRKALRDTITPGVDELRAMEVARLDALMGALWELALNGNLRAMDRVIRIIELRSKILGLFKVQENYDGRDAPPTFIEVHVRQSPEANGDVPARIMAPSDQGVERDH